MTVSGGESLMWKHYDRGRVWLGSEFRENGNWKELCLWICNLLAGGECKALGGVTKWASKWCVNEWSSDLVFPHNPQKTAEDRQMRVSCFKFRGALQCILLWRLAPDYGVAGELHSDLTRLMKAQQAQVKYIAWRRSKEAWLPHEIDDKLEQKR